MVARALCPSILRSVVVKLDLLERLMKAGKPRSDRQAQEDAGDELAARCGYPTKRS